MEQLRSAFESLSQWWFDLHFSRNQKRFLALIAVVVLLSSVIVVARGNTESNAVTEIVPITIAEPEIFVDVTGAVNRPGVYTLTGKSRVIDAIKAAGDSAPGADLSTMNLARVLNDGEQIYVDSLVVNGLGQRISKKTPSGPININRATARQLDALDGIGPVIAARIVEYRKINGSFLSVDDLQKVTGIGAAKFAQIKSKVKI
ncbi:MAG: ComEA family DNA-binding protein [Actinomycetales bacterium]|nr:ComEA family DNA-binding protein [Actinomycetales bacterium]